MKVILFACIEKNIGDDLFIYTICNKYPNIDFYISENACYGDLKKLNNLHFSKILKIWSNFQNGNSKSAFKELIKKVLSRVLEIFIGKNNIVIYIVGNAFKNMNYDKSLNQTKWLKARINIAKEFYLLSTNFGPYVDEAWKNDCMIEFEKMTDICFRDKYSFSLFNELNNVRYAPDAILSLPVNSDLNVTKNKVLISMIDCSMKNRGNKINKMFEVYENKLSEIAKHYSKMGLEVILLTSNNSQDLPSAQRIMEKCKGHSNISIFEYNGNFFDVIKLYESAKYVISTRLHTMILAWIHKCPVLPIVYDMKIRNLLESYNFNNKYYDILEVDSLDVCKIDDYFNNYKFNNLNEIILESENQFMNLNIRFLK